MTPRCDAPIARLRGLRVLVVEDEYLVADDLRRGLEMAGAHVLGPVPSVRLALDLLASSNAPDVAILDVNLGGEAVVPVADALIARGIRFVFATGYDGPVMPAAYRGIPCCERPFDLAAIATRLFE
ncbi:response regulator [Lysobacter sp. TY2-98]|uniref:response regulator n=1 Tax=Lysobacter sp. TY2-98 TaxID=2290922 RepID=UPI000E1FB90E|nr:response regulator [Lysobacter sp. TY2-98]AXK73735.1 response regulator [Lysobacter sp. TY2-98]